MIKIYPKIARIASAKHPANVVPASSSSAELLRLRNKGAGCSSRFTKVGYTSIKIVSLDL